MLRGDPIAWRLIISLLISLLPVQAFALDNSNQPSAIDKRSANSTVDKDKDSEENQDSDKVTKYLIGYKNQTGKAKAESKGKLQHQFKHANLVLAELDSAIKEELARDPDIEFIEPDSIVRAEASEQTSWGYTALDTATVHDQGYLGQGVTIAVLDTSIDITHPDLSTEPGISFVGNSAQDDQGHGTQVAGVINAQLNSEGVKGLNPAAAIYPVKVLDHNGQGTYSTVIQGIEWAIDNNIDIISMSFGGQTYSRALEQAINLAAARDIQLVAAAGNQGNSGGDNILYPAKYDAVLAVGSVNQQGDTSFFSSSGPQLELLAPGEGILTTNSGGTYLNAAGTSIAAAHATGTAALVMAANQQLSSEATRQVLVQSAIDTGAAAPVLSASQAVALATGLTVEAGQDKTKDKAQKPDSASGNAQQKKASELEEGTVSAASIFDYNTDIGPSVMNGTNELKYSAWSDKEEIISPQTGDLTLKLTDLVLPGRNGFDLKLGRIYQSNQSVLGDRRFVEDTANGNYNYNDYSTYYLRRYALGLGWSFSFPSVQVEQAGQQEQLYYHTGNGAVYKVNEDNGIYTLENYYIQDAEFQQSSTFSYDGLTSAYLMETADKTQRYFAADGRLLGIVDRFDNQIKFKYVEQPVTNYAPNSDFEVDETPRWEVNSYYSYDNGPSGVGKDDNSSLKFVSNSSGTFSSLSDYIPVLPSTKYYLSGYLYYENNNFHNLITETKIDRYLPGAGTTTLYTGYTYNDWGGSATETRPLTPAQWNDPAIKNLHTVSYTYDVTYNFRESRSYYQQPGTLLTESTTYDAAYGRITATTNAKNQVTEYQYTTDPQDPYVGNARKIIVDLDGGKTSMTEFDYSGAYNAFPTTTTVHHTDPVTPVRTRPV